MGTAIRRLTWIFVTCLAPLAGCGFDGDAARLGLDDEASSSTESPITASCTATGHVAEINTIWSVIQSNCGGITGCGTRDVRDTHVDVFIPHANYCACYAMLFANRTRAPFNGVQIIYHEQGACTGSGAHIHLEKLSTFCPGRIHFDLDEAREGSGGQDCVDDEPAAWKDRYFGGGNCLLVNRAARQNNSVSLPCSSKT